MKLIVLSGRDVHELLPYAECVPVMREALAELARGRIQQPLRTIVRPRDAAGFMALMPAYASLPADPARLPRPRAERHRCHNDAHLTTWLSQRHG